jgi:hypothetical protein
MLSLLHGKKDKHASQDFTIKENGQAPRREVRETA